MCKLSSILIISCGSGTKPGTGNTQTGNTQIRLDTAEEGVTVAINEARTTVTITAPTPFSIRGYTEKDHVRIINQAPDDAVGSQGVSLSELNAEWGSTC